MPTKKLIRNLYSYTSVTLPLLPSLLSFCVPYYMRVLVYHSKFWKTQRKRERTRTPSRTFPYRNKIQWSFWLISVTWSLYQLSIGWLRCLINRPQQTICVCRWILSSLINQTDIVPTLPFKQELTHTLFKDSLYWVLITTNKWVIGIEVGQCGTSSSTYIIGYCTSVWALK